MRREKKKNNKELNKENEKSGLEGQGVRTSSKCMENIQQASECKMCWQEKGK